MFFATAAAGPRSVTNSVPARRPERRRASGPRAARRASLPRAAAPTGPVRRGRRPGGARRARQVPVRRARGPARRAAGAAAPGRPARPAPAGRNSPAARRGRRPGPSRDARGHAGGGAGGPALARGGGRRGGAVRLVVGEEVPPGSVYRVRVLEVLLVDLIDKPLVRAETRCGALALHFVVGRDTRAIGGLWRHGGNRPLPLHKMVDSGNKGYAYRTPRRSSGGPSSHKSHPKTGFSATTGGKLVPLVGWPGQWSMPIAPVPGSRAGQRPRPSRRAERRSCGGSVNALPWARPGG